MAAGIEGKVVKRIIIIDMCGRCPNIRTEAQKHPFGGRYPKFYCNHDSQKRSVSPHSIPDWCRLEAAP